MIKAIELRIGNMLNYDTVIEGVLVTKIDWQDLKWISQDRKDFNRVHNPIPLTEEWLLIFGEIKGKSDRGTFPMYYNIIDKHLYVDNNFAQCDKISWMPILYVHQLQNLFYALTGEELTINI
jgi:hypothetical protein